MRGSTIARLWWVPVLLLGTTGCVVRLGHWSSDSSTTNGNVMVRNDRVYLDGVELKHERWVDVASAAPASGQLVIETATGEISLSGSSGSGLELQAHLYSEFEGEGRAVVEGGALKAVADTGKAYINGVRGMLPSNLGLDLETGTGPITLDGFSEGASLAVQTGTGPIHLSDCTVKSVELDMGTADARLDRVHAGRLDIDTGTGDVFIDGGGADSVKIDTSTGDVTVNGARITTVRVDSGTGDVVLQDCTLGSVKMDSGTGDLTLRGGTCDEVDLDSGTGDLRLRDGAVVGSKRES